MKQVVFWLSKQMIRNVFQPSIVIPIQKMRWNNSTMMQNMHIFHNSLYPLSSFLCQVLIGDPNSITAFWLLCRMTNHRTWVQIHGLVTVDVSKPPMIQKITIAVGDFLDHDHASVFQDSSIAGECTRPRKSPAPWVPPLNCWNLDVLKCHNVAVANH